MAKASLVNREMSHTHTYIYICDTDHKMRAKNTAQLFKVYHFFRFDLVITSKHLCDSKVAFLHKQGENICTAQCRLFQKSVSLDNIVILGNRQLPLCGAWADTETMELQGAFFPASIPTSTKHWAFYTSWWTGNFCPSSIRSKEWRVTFTFSVQKRCFCVQFWDSSIVLNILFC